MKEDLTKIYTIELGLALALFRVKSNAEQLSPIKMSQSHTVCGDAGDTTRERRQLFIGNLLLALDPICFCTQFQFHCDKQLKRIQIIMCYQQPLSNTHNVQTQAHRNSHLGNAKRLVLLPEIPLAGGSSARCSTPVTPQQTQPRPCPMLLRGCSGQRW